MIFTQLSNELSVIFQYTLEKLPSVALALVIFSIFLFISRPLASLLTRPLQKRNDSRLILLVVRRMISLLFILLGLYILLRLMGLTQFAVALLSGTGVLGLIVGFAFKDIAENFLSSLLLSVQRPFKLGDIIYPSHLKMQDSASRERVSTKALIEENGCSIVEINNAGDDPLSPCPKGAKLENQLRVAYTDVCTELLPGAKKLCST